MDSLPHREWEKKITQNVDAGRQGHPGYPIETFRDRLRDLCDHHLGGDGGDRAGRIQEEAQQAIALAGEFGLLKVEKQNWDAFCRQNPDLHYGTEHAVESDAGGSLMVKITKPPGFGLIPTHVLHRIPNLRGEKSTPDFRSAIEFQAASPLAYLNRWSAANEIFGDDVRLASVVSWSDGMVSFVILQPQYHGVPADPREIERFFLEAGWTLIRDPTRQHQLFYNYAFQILAIDAFPRNCFVHKGNFLPFDVILCHPEQSLEQLLKLYPD